jgi:MFS family permease
MFVMGFATMAVGLLPTYQQVGILAPVLLVILRLIQGFAVAGEISGASSMILEHAPFGRRGYFSSFSLQGVQAGQLLAAAVFLPIAHFMPTEAFNSYGWRIPFLLSALVIVAGYIIRREVRKLLPSPKRASTARSRSRRSSKPSGSAGWICCESSAWP